ncbi:UvrD-helicase domain-containing protein [Amycolatopsis sp. CB00013]|uniref:UvrD-helicase domain-containing protein n=1 Tax=Amycolatopsis sp. CB00013 TaxID=1703945 RepID=UPI00093F66D2|nr:UvrD-helicase domain-containing protein [Amycolatopsis sp. CB00013]OKJ92942.1 hypothetical protein AMK34_31360 [Amycolatopsis sp. CB00013]
MTSIASPSDTRPKNLTNEQAAASGSLERRLFIDAGPGTGKTTVAAQRFGALRFAPESRTDHRAIIAVSFTRAATWTLKQRVRRIWGPAALTWPHRIVTLDTIMCDLMHDLLRAGLLRWPNGHTELTVIDSWSALAQTKWTKKTYKVYVDAADVKFVKVNLEGGARVPLTEIGKHLAEGICTHQDVRDALENALKNETMAAHSRDRLKVSAKALIVDEVFDANDLDIAIIELATQAGLSVTLVGDPWQALYMFRGARPDAIPALLARTGITTLALTESFRWRGPMQRKLAANLREGHGVTLDLTASDALEGKVDVALATEWKPLWQASDGILPLAFHSFKGGIEEAAATLLLNHVTRSALGENATYLADALMTLSINAPDAAEQLNNELHQVVETLVGSEKDPVRAAYAKLAEITASFSPRRLRRAHAAHTIRLKLIAARLEQRARLIPGLTTHQAKGGEWDAVGVVLSRLEQARLQGGLTHEQDTDRKLYVACTRARMCTVLIATETAE